jgi:hypothetical protein
MFSDPEREYPGKFMIHRGAAEIAEKTVRKENSPISSYYS